MTLRDIRLKPMYISLEDDVSAEFYVPVMSNSIRFDRISCYFSFDAIASYCRGIYHLGCNGGLFRLLISENVSKETFETIRDGYEGYRILDEETRERMRDELSLEDTVTLSNLAYLMKCGLVQIKFAFCHDGLFHEKTGFAADSQGNKLCFTGSNNETRASFDNNYEKFEVTASWLSSDFDALKIVKTAEEFESMWNGVNNHVITIDPPESFDSYMETFNRGRLVESVDDLSNDAFILDSIDGRARISLPNAIQDPRSFKFKISIQSFVDTIEGRTIDLKMNLKRSSLRTIADKIHMFADKGGLSVIETQSFKNLVESSTAMEELASLGLSIKHRDPVHIDTFEIFKNDVSSLTSAGLREEQLWDAYFAYSLGKSANFSVPGSGKTATALGMFAYLYKNKGVKRLIVLGPLNSFDSWISEFRRVFGDNIPSKAVTSTELRGMGGPIQYHVRLDIGDRNLVLLNYESFDHNPELTDALRDRIGDDTMLVFDEVHRIKAVNGKRASNIVPIGEKSKYTIVMTGTPIPNGYEDVYNFLHILYGSNYDDFFVLSPRALSRLQGLDVVSFNEKLQPFYVRTTKAQLGVPAADGDMAFTVDAGEDEQALFDRLHDVRINPLALMIRILQVESDPSMLASKTLDESERAAFADDLPPFEVEGVLEDTEAVQLVTSKTRRCIEIVEDLVSQGRTVIVWCIFIKSIRNIVSLLESKGISVCSVYGATEDKQTVIDSFKAGRYKVLVTNPQTLAESVSLHKVCHDAVYFEYSYNLVHLLQSRDRIHRLGLDPGQHTRYHFLETRFHTVEGAVSLDRDIHDRLNQKEEVMLNAIENHELESFGSDREEIESILEGIGFDRSLFKK